MPSINHTGGRCESLFDEIKSHWHTLSVSLPGGILVRTFITHLCAVPIEVYICDNDVWNTILHSALLSKVSIHNVLVI